MVYTVRL